MPHPPRRYGDSEIARLLERAADLQARRGGGASEGLTLDELRQVALEAGIDPDMISAAAAELDAGATPTPPILAPPPGAPGQPVDGGESAEPKQIFGDASAWVETMDVPVRLTDADVDRLVRRVEASLARRGNKVRTGSVAQWFVTSRGEGNAMMQVEPLPHGSRLRLTVDQHERAQGVHTAIPGMGFIAGALLGMTTGESIVALSLATAGGLSGHLLGRVTWHLAARRWRRKVDDLMSGLVGDAIRHGEPVGRGKEPPPPSLPAER